jgi:CHAT domain-containing protein/tetratricopeptide (TPR) repeat protein
VKLNNSFYSVLIIVTCFLLPSCAHHIGRSGSPPVSSQSANLEHVDDLIDKAFDAYYRKEIKEATQKLESAALLLAESPQRTLKFSLQIVLAFLYGRLSDTDKLQVLISSVNGFLLDIKNNPIESQKLSTNTVQLASRLTHKDRLTFWEECLSIIRPFYGKTGEAFVLTQIAETNLSSNQFTEAYQKGMEALQVAKETGDFAIQADACVVVSGSLISLGRGKEAEDLLQNFLSQPIDKRLRSYVLSQLGLVKNALGKAGEGIEIFEQAIELARSANNPDLEARVFLKLGFGCLISGNFLKAVESFQISQEIFKKAGEKSQTLALELIIATAYFASNEFQKAHEHASIAAERYQRLRNKGEEAKALRLSGESLAKLNNFDEALSVLEKAVFIQVEEDHKGAIETFWLIIDLLKKEGRSWDVKRALLTSLDDKYNEVFRTRKEIEAKIRYELASVDSVLGFFGEALQQLNEALNLYSQLSDKKMVVLSLLQATDILTNLRDFENRLHLLVLAERIAGELGDPFIRLQVMNSTAKAYVDAGRVVEAGQQYIEAVNLSKSIDEYAYLTQLNILAMFYQRIGDTHRAAEIFEKSVRVAKEAGDQLSTAMALWGLSEVYYHQNECTTSVKKAQEALDLLKVTPSLKPMEHQLTRQLCLGLIAGRQYDAAIDVANDLVKLSIKSGNPHFISSAYNILGHIRLKLGKYALAVEAYKTSIDAVEFLLGKVEYHDVRPKFFENLLSQDPFSSFDGVVEAYYHLYALDPDANRSYAEEAFYFAESCKARTWRDRLSRYRIWAIRDEIPGEIKKNIDLHVSNTHDTCSAFENSISRYGVRPEEQEKKKEACDEALLKQKSYRAYLEAEYPKLAGLIFSIVTSLDHLAIREGEDIIAFKLTPDYVFSWVINRSNGKNAIQRFSRLPVKNEELIKHLIKLLNPFDKLEPLVSDTKVASNLYAMILQPILDGLELSNNLIIIPDGVLNVVPFEMFETGMERGDNPKGIRYFGDQFSISYYPSAAVMTLNRQINLIELNAPGSLFIVADPVYNQEDERLRLIQVGQKREVLETKEFNPNVETDHTGKIDQRGSLFGRLRYTAKEAQNIEHIFRNVPGEKSILEGLEASEKNVKLKDLSHYKYLHFAVHGILSYDVPQIKEPSLVLSMFPSDSEEDGFLTMDEILRLKLNADLVTLSACKTALGANITGEGIVGLSRAFMISGARSVVVSLWEVPDEATSILMQQFYQNIVNGYTKAEALARAKHYMRERGYENPYFWAAFVLIGD